MLRNALSALRLPKSSALLSKRAFADADKSLFEKAKETVGKATATVGQAFKDEGVVGKQFQDNKDGLAAKAAQKVADVMGSESLQKDGSIGKKFTDEGAIGAKVDKAGKKINEKGQDLKAEANEAAK